MNAMDLIKLSEAKAESRYAMAIVEAAKKELQMYKELSHPTTQKLEAIAGIWSEK